MNINLDCELEIQAKISTQDATYGTKKTSWLTVANCWARILDKRPSRTDVVVASVKEASSKRSNIVIRYEDGYSNALTITTAHRFRLASPRERIFQIIGQPAEIGGRQAFLEFECEELFP